MKIYIEGNIGAGKSTYVKFLKNTYDTYKFLLEPVKTWLSYKNSDGINLLDNFYRDQERWSYTFQMAAFMTRIRDIQKAERENPDKSLVIERSIFSDRNCFAELGYKNGAIGEMEWSIYNDWFNWLKTEFWDTIRPDIVIYLECPPELCARRIAERNRSEESSIPIEYLTDLHKRHEIMMKEFEKEGITVIRIDASRDIHSDSEYFKDVFGSSSPRSFHRRT